MVTFGHSNAKGDLKTSKSPVPLLRGGSPQGWAYGSEYFLWIIGNMENVCTFVPSLIKVCYNLLQIRHHPNDVFSFFLNHTTEGRTLKAQRKIPVVLHSVHKNLQCNSLNIWYIQEVRTPFERHAYYGYVCLPIDSTMQKVTSKHLKIYSASSS